MDFKFLASFPSLLYWVRSTSVEDALYDVKLD
jgi:hypothetical protein